jgi:hypothetical protein
MESGHCDGLVVREKLWVCYWMGWRFSGVVVTVETRNAEAFVPAAAVTPSPDLPVT